MTTKIKVHKGWVLQKKRLERLNDLYENALAGFLQKADFNLYEWLTEAEAEEYEDLLVKTGQKVPEDLINR